MLPSTLPSIWQPSAISELTQRESGADVRRRLVILFSEDGPLGTQELGADGGV